MKREITNEQFLELKGWKNSGCGFWIDPITKSHFEIELAISTQERWDKGVCNFYDLERIANRVFLLEVEIKIMKKKKWYQFWK